MKAKIKYNLKQNGEDALEMDYKGIFNVLKDGEYKLSYTSEKVLNTLLINQNKMVVSIANKNILYFEKGVSSNIEYKTDFGTLDLKLVCRDVQIDSIGKEVYLKLNYDLFQGDEPLSNELNIVISY